ncbi:hypothetical protein SO802_007796 [Lithocarpus litseifolius]|uniref:GRF-type domain-containing protein n=1 Tax=Lithocarpus litseifolius TaxID=425828 RepID=A0AAW2DSY9_9ROSI
MSDAIREDIDDGLRFQNSNCLCGLRTSMRISNKRNENRYRLFQCCPKDACRFFQWCIPLKMSLSYAEEFQQLQEELCVLREELRVMHDKVHPVVETKKNGKDYVHWMVSVMHRACTTANYDNGINKIVMMATSSLLCNHINLNIRDLKRVYIAKTEEDIGYYAGYVGENSFIT